MAHPTPGSNDWLNQVKEEIIDPDRPIIDPHHHLWKRRFGSDYLLDELWSDTGSGHNVVQTVFMECGAFYLREGRSISDLWAKPATSPNWPQQAPPLPTAHCCRHHRAC